MAHRHLSDSAITPFRYGNATGNKPITGNWDGTTTNLDTTPGIIR